MWISLSSLYTSEYSSSNNNISNHSMMMISYYNYITMIVYHIVLPLIGLFLLFDIFYGFFHYILHLQILYPYIHKHHHIQKAPSRGNVDAINVHPIEFLFGEYNHLFILYIYTNCIPYKIHCYATILFLIFGGLLAGMNHTRYDCKPT